MAGETALLPQGDRMSGLGAPRLIPPPKSWWQRPSWEAVGHSWQVRERKLCVGREESLGGSQLFLPLLQVNLVIISLRTG